MPRRRDRSRDKLGEELSDMIEAGLRDRMQRKLGPGTELPDGVVTIVFTDVEGSTELVRELGDHEARPILRRHDEVVREVLREHDGIEVERSGDAFMLAFRLPSQAVGFALRLQDRLAGDGEVKVRIGLDTGEVIREEKGYFGKTVIRAARIAELGRGGQVMVSHATRILAESAPGARFVDRGDKALEGLGGSHRVFEVVSAEPGGTA